MRKSVTLLLAAASMSAVSCSRGHAAQDAGPTISRNYPVGNFRQIDVAGPYDVTVRTGANASVAAQGPQNYLDRIVVEVKGDKLVIRPKGQRGWVNEGWTKRVKANFTITVPQ